jgi:hypothetical protein
MTNNDFFALMLHLTGLGKDKMLLIEIFRMGGNLGVTKSMIDGWRRPLGHKRATVINDLTMKQFFDGLFAYRDMKRLEGIEVFNFEQTRMSQETPQGL